MEKYDEEAAAIKRHVAELTKLDRLPTCYRLLFFTGKGCLLLSA